MFEGETLLITGGTGSFGRTAVGRAAEKEGIAIFFEKKLKTILSENHMSPPTQTKNGRDP